jgi:hypothetical protein
VWKNDSFVHKSVCVQVHFKLLNALGNWWMIDSRFDKKGISANDK